ncbi:DNA replication complex GINS protein PSF1 [Echinococcus multilocularis]|uniref:DNA replication complex GINS protein PSF1 n=1 Tax=Echinococcus multilocularis TaxID=6211 RepID=A0A068YDQ7_ECHMU|nr:DNA replication complex GINS protein PSF1 [Echinococcus multilocularis]
MSVTNIAMDLIKSVKRSTSHRLAPYDDDKVRRCIEEMRQLYEENRQDLLSLRLPSQSSSSADGSATVRDRDNIVQTVVIRHATMERVKRCLLAYHHARLMQIKEIRWQYGAGIPKEIRQNMSNHELKWFSNYCTALASFMRADADEMGGSGGLDLTQSLKPPKSLLLEVRCLKDYGEFETECGNVINLTKGSQHLMFRSDCENLILQGVLQHIID